MAKKKIVLCNSVADRREFLSLSQEDLAKRTGSTKCTIQAIEENSYECSIRMALLISYVLDLPVNELFELDVFS